jgi:hypothetical protein
MRQWFSIIISAWKQKWPFATFILAFFSTLDFILGRIAPQKLDNIMPRGCDLIPWYWWVIIWILFLFFMILDYATKQRLKISELENSKETVPQKTNFDLFINFLDKKTGQELINDPYSPSVHNSVVTWEKKIKNGLILFFGGEEKIDNVIKHILSDIRSRVMGLGLYPSMDQEEVKRIVAKCQGFVQEMKKHINPTMMSKDFNPHDLDK